MATAQQALRWVERLYQRLADRRPGVEKAFRYFEGQQPLAYASEQWTKFHADRYKDFSDNWCGVVGRSPVDRLRIDGFRLGGPTDALTADEQQLWSDWNRNDLEAQSAQGFLAATVAKRSYALVWGTGEEPVVSWEHPAQAVVDYVPGGRTRRAGLKAWVDDRTEYATLYLPDGIYKFERPTYLSEDERNRLLDRGFVIPTSLALSGWEPREVRGEPWPLPNPLDEVPLVEWPNRPQLDGEPLSDIQGTIAMQDAINMLWAYLFAAADHASMAARVVTGADWPNVPVLDKNGQKIGVRPAKLEDIQQGRFLFIPGEHAKIDQWDAARLDVFTEVVTQAVGHIASQTQTPGHYLLTNEKFANLNGDALTAAEVPLADKVGSAQVTGYNPAAKETTRLMAKVRGLDGMADEIAARNGREFVQWKDRVHHTPNQIADAATKDRAVGLSLRTVLERRYGMTEQEIDREFERVAAEQSDPTLDRITRGLINVADRGEA